MTIQLNHTIVAAHDKNASAAFLSNVLGIEPPTVLGHFTAVQVGDTSLDYMSADGEITPQHYAFLVSESEFDDIFARILDRGMAYWSDPHHHHQGEINTWDDGRGCYFDDPDGHRLEILTRPYGSGGTTASHPNPLIAPKLDPSEHEGNHAEQE